MKKTGVNVFLAVLVFAWQAPVIALPLYSDVDDANAIRQPDSRKSILQAVKSIKQQTEEGHLRVRKEGTAMAERVVKQSNQIVHRIHVQRDGDLSELGLRVSRASAFFQARESEIRYQSMTDENAARQNARLEAARHVRLATERAQALESCATALESQLLEGPKKSGVRLTALGTNLYVRNYVSYIEPPVELVATPMVSTSGKYYASAHGRTTTSVQGKIIAPSHHQ